VALDRPSLHQTGVVSVRLSRSVLAGDSSIRHDPIPRARPGPRSLYRRQPHALVLQTRSRRAGSCAAGEAVRGGKEAVRRWRAGWRSQLQHPRRRPADQNNNLNPFTSHRKNRPGRASAAAQASEQATSGTGSRTSSGALGVMMNRGTESRPQHACELRRRAFPASTTALYVPTADVKIDRLRSGPHPERAAAPRRRSQTTRNPYASRCLS